MSSLLKRYRCCACEKIFINPDDISCDCGCVLEIDTEYYINRVSELEAALRDIAHGPVGYWNEPQHREATIAHMMRRADEVLMSNKEVE